MGGRPPQCAYAITYLPCTTAARSSTLSLYERYSDNAHMPRKLTRRERRERQRERDEAREAGLPVREPEAAPAKRDREAGVSYTGLFGGLLGSGIFFALTIAILIDPGEGSRLWAIAFGIGGLFFLPAIVVSAVPGHPRRESVLRWATIGCMLIAMLGLLTFGVGVAIILAPTTALLAIGAGFIFQGSGTNK